MSNTTTLRTRPTTADCAGAPPSTAHPLESAGTADPSAAHARAPAGARTIRVALAGCGTVGGELLRLLDGNRADLERQGVRFDVVRVLVRDPARDRPVSVRRDRFTRDLDAFLDTPYDLLVEAIGGLDPAERLVRHALSRGRDVVTANKALVAARGDALAALARERGAALSFEAAVAGGVPVVRALRESLPHTGVRSIRGILNGTTNYILTRMTEGAAFAHALEEAQAKGFAEADPTLDLNGQDAADKTALLAWQAFGTPLGRLRVDRAGLLPDPDRLVSDAAAVGGVVRLLAECVRLEDAVVAAVEPVIVDRESAFARAAAEENLVVVETAASGVLRLSGPGAGGGPTASAVLSDMVRAAPAPTSDPASAGAPDPRPHRWLLSVRSDAKPRVAAAARDAVLRAAAREGVAASPWDEDARAGSARVLTAPLPRQRARALAASLDPLGLRPSLLRYAAGD